MVKTYPVTPISPILHIKQAAMTSHTLVIITVSARVWRRGVFPVSMLAVCVRRGWMHYMWCVRPLTALDSKSICTACMSNYPSQHISASYSSASEWVSEWVSHTEALCVCLCIHQRVLCRRLPESVMWIKEVIGRIYVLSCPGRLFSIAACLPWSESLFPGLILLFHLLWLSKNHLILSASSIHSLINLQFDLNNLGFYFF